MATSQQVDLGPFLTNVYGERYLHSVNHSVFNQVGAEALYTDRFAETFSEERKLFLIIGSDSGLLIRFLLNIQVGANSRVLLIEFPEVIARLAEVLDLQALPDWLVLTTPDEWLGQLTAVDFTTYVFLDGVHFYESVGAEYGFLEEYKIISGEVRTQLEAACWKVKADISSEAYIREQIGNLADNVQPAACLENVMSGKTAVVLGGGPSLDEILPWLKEHRDEVVILAVSRISRRLQQVGLLPHLVVSVDPNWVSFRVSKEVFNYDPPPILVHTNHANQIMIASWCGPKLYLGERYPWRSSLEKDNFDIVGPTVTNVALDLALRMGAQQVILAGFDLCFSKEGLSHAQGSEEREAGPRLEQNHISALNNAGELAKTTHAFYAASQDLARQALEAKERGCRLVNISLNALRVEHIEYLPLDQVEISPLDEAPGLLLKRAVADLDKAERRADLKKLKAELSRVMVSLKKVENLASEALECNEGLFGRKGKTADFKYKKRMDKIEKTLNRDFSDLVLLIKTFGLNWFVKTIRTDGSDWSDEEIEETGRVYYETYLKSSRELSLLLEQSAKRLDCRLRELSDPPSIEDFVVIFEQWRQDRGWGRAKLWLTLYGDLPIPEKCRTYMHSLTDYFYKNMVQALKGYSHFYNQKVVEAEAAQLFKRNDLDGLKRLLGAVDHYLSNRIEEVQKTTSKESVENERRLIAGYVSELAGEQAAALQEYNQILDSSEQDLTEVALSRIASLSLQLNDQENSLLAFECLAGLSPAYLPQYAALLEALGRFADAADVYANYLEKVPEDRQIMLRLGQLYLKAGAAEAAATMFRFLLEKDPGNSAARLHLEQMKGEA